jgi:hypothetical protein
VSTVADLNKATAIEASGQTKTCQKKAAAGAVRSGRASVIVSDNSGATAVTDARTHSMPRGAREHDSVDAKRAAQA